MVSASGRFLAPSSREMLLPDPMPKKKAMAWMMAMVAKVTPTAAVDAVSILLTK